MSDKVFRLKKGFDLHIYGKPQLKLATNFKPNTFAVKPPDFIGIKPIPKVTVDLGDEVKAGDPLFFDKPSPEILYTAPVSGEIVAVNRAAKRSIAEVVILADKNMKFKSFKKLDPISSSAEEIIKLMLESGTWPMLRQRPYNVLADPTRKPRAMIATRRACTKLRRRSFKNGATKSCSQLTRSTRARSTSSSAERTTVASAPASGSSARRSAPRT